MSESIDDLKSELAALLAQARKFQRELLEMRDELEAAKKERDIWALQVKTELRIHNELRNACEAASTDARQYQERLQRVVDGSKATETRCQELQKQLGECGKENCMGLTVDGVRSWVTKERLEKEQARYRDLERAVEAKDAALRDGIDYILGGHAIACMNVSEGSEPCDKCWPCKRLKARHVMVAALSAAPQSAGEAKCHCDAEADLADRPGARCADCPCQQPAPKPSAAEGKFPCGCVKPAASGEAGK